MSQNTIEEILKGIGSTVSTEPRSVSEITEEVDCNQKTAAKYLRALQDSGLLETWTIDRIRLYWIKPGVGIEQRFMSAPE